MRPPLRCVRGLPLLRAGGMPPHRPDAVRGVSGGRQGVSDPAEAVAAVMAKADALLVEVRHARITLAAAPEGPERTVYLRLLESFEKGLLAALEDVVAELKTLRGCPEAAAWLRRRLEGLGKGGDS